MPANVSPVATPVVVMVPPTKFNNVFDRTLTPVPALALMVPPVLSTLMVCDGPEVALEERAIPAVVLLIVPLLATLMVAVPVLVADIPVAEVMVPVALFSNTTFPLPAWEAEIPAVATFMAAPELI
ncbi:Uncharacterised protein [Yersinia frederiksenii]|nr:Uncharacterised protein [Yersinia frederiksenii]